MQRVRLWLDYNCGRDARTRLKGKEEIQNRVDDVNDDNQNDEVGTKLTNKLIFIDLPLTPPILWTDQRRYSPGDLLYANCSTPPSRPPATLSFQLNYVPVSTSPTTSFSHLIIITLLKLYLSESKFTLNCLGIVCDSL